MTLQCREGVETRGAHRASIAFFFWVLLILAQLGFLFSVHHEERHNTTADINKFAKSVPRKARFFETRQSFHAPPSQAQSKGDPDKVYGDDKRIIHTGPNPLHN